MVVLVVVVVVVVVVAVVVVLIDSHTITRTHTSHTMSSLYPPVLQHLSGILGMGQVGPTSTLHDGSS